MNWVNGSIYEGEFKNRTRSGFGRYIYVNGAYYEGEWLAGKRNGAGKQIGPKGTIEEGFFENNILLNPKEV